MSKELSKVVKRLFKEIHYLEKNKDIEEKVSLLENTYFLSGGKVLCKERTTGVSRFPYGNDGFTLWAYSSGYISANESTFYIILPSEEGKEPYLAFYAGEINKSGKYTPISLLGRGRNPLEGDSIKRYCVYGKECVYYLCESKDFTYAVRIFVSDKKEIIFNVFAKNMKNKEKRIYLSSFMNCLFKYSNGESMETKWFKKCTYEDNMFIFDSPEDVDRLTHIDNFGLIKRRVNMGTPKVIENTTSRSVYVGGKENSIVNSSPLLLGHFEKEKLVTHFTDTASVGDIIVFDMEGKEEIETQYVISFAHSEDEFMKLKRNDYSKEYVEKLLSKKIRELQNKERKQLQIAFEDWKDKSINSDVLNQFIKYVIYQTEYCGLAKNSGALFLGVRDVMQQVETALMWARKECRKKILEVLSYIDSSGNPPRQYSIPPKGSTPKMDLRPFIDQGVWIISTVYNYLAYTGDMSILDEVIGYYDRLLNGGVILSSRKDTVLDHLIQVMEYLIKHIDTKTNCLRAMYGDWNDALDGLGVSKDKDKDYGDGVSVMATLQLYKNLKEMIELLSLLGDHDELVALYKVVRLNIEKGINKYAIVKNGSDKRIIHGWGENRSYFVGSYNDVDNKSRNSLTANAFLVISHMLEKTEVSKKDIVKAYENLDSKYGLKTFEPYFEKDVKGVGRIINLPKGTAENGATYVHATLFGALSLFMLNEGKLAYEQIEKVLPLTHANLTTTPFVMPNSYSYNLDEDMDGESMSDWYTGSANTFIKTLVWGAFGINVTLEGLSINPCSYFNSKRAYCAIKIRNCNVSITYIDKGGHNRRISVNGRSYKDKSISFDFKTLARHDHLDVLVEDEE